MYMNVYTATAKQQCNIMEKTLCLPGSRFWHQVTAFVKGVYFSGPGPCLKACVHLAP